MTLFNWLALGSLLFAAIPEDDITKINLDSYLKNLGSQNEVRKVDVHGTGKTDLYLIFKTSASSRVLEKYLYDTNQDGHIDLVEYLRGKIVVRREADLDFDQKVDVISENDPETGELLKKTQFDGSNLTWRYWNKNELRRKELDRNKDRKPDLWVYYKGGKVIRTEIDQNFDGKSIKIEAGSLLRNTDL